MPTFYKTAETIEYSEKNNIEFIVASQYNESNGRKYKTYKDVDEYINENENKNKQAYEILKGGNECKLYMDIEFINEDEKDFNPNTLKFEEIKRSLKKHYNEYFKMELKDVDLLICDCSGIGESGIWLGKFKNSYHIIVNNGYFLRITKI